MPLEETRSSRESKLTAELADLRAQSQHAADEVSGIQARRREITDTVADHAATISRLEAEMKNLRAELHDLVTQEEQASWRLRDRAARTREVESWLAADTGAPPRREKKPGDTKDCRCGGNNPDCVDCGGRGWIERD
jgi:chromosome segregation ATPase